MGFSERARAVNKDCCKCRQEFQEKGATRKVKKHSDLYTDENPKGTIHGLKFATVRDAEASVRRIRASGKTHAHKTQAAIAMEQRARAAGKKAPAAVYRKFIEAQKRKTKQRIPSSVTYARGLGTF